MFHISTWTAANSGRRQHNCQPRQVRQGKYRTHPNKNADVAACGQGGVLRVFSVPVRESCCFFPQLHSKPNVMSNGCACSEEGRMLLISLEMVFFSFVGSTAETIQAYPREAAYHSPAIPCSQKPSKWENQELFTFQFVHEPSLPDFVLSWRVWSTKTNLLRFGCLASE